MEWGGTRLACPPPFNYSSPQTRDFGSAAPCVEFKPGFGNAERPVKDSIFFAHVSKVRGAVARRDAGFGATNHLDETS